MTEINSNKKLGRRVKKLKKNYLYSYSNYSINYLKIIKKTLKKEPL